MIGHSRTSRGCRVSRVLGPLVTRPPGWYHYGPMGPPRCLQVSPLAPLCPLVSPRAPQRLSDRPSSIAGESTPVLRGSFSKSFSETVRMQGPTRKHNEPKEKGDLGQHALITAWESGCRTILIIHFAHYPAGFRVLSRSAPS